MNVEYFQEHEPYGINYKELKPTGKWKIVSGPYYVDHLFIQHQGLIFRRWVSETMIVSLPKRQEKIFTCKGT